MTIEGKAVLVTGANRGIGHALVEEAFSRGAKRVYGAEPSRRSRPRSTPTEGPARCNPSTTQDRS